MGSDSIAPKLFRRLKPALQNRWQARKADVLTITPRVTPCYWYEWTGKSGEWSPALPHSSTSPWGEHVRTFQLVTSHQNTSHHLSHSSSSFQQFSGGGDRSLSSSASSSSLTTSSFFSNDSITQGIFHKCPIIVFNRFHHSRYFPQMPHHIFQKTPSLQVSSTNAPSSFSKDSITPGIFHKCPIIIFKRFYHSRHFPQMPHHQFKKNPSLSYFPQMPHMCVVTRMNTLSYHLSLINTVFAITAASTHDQDTVQHGDTLQTETAISP